MKCKPGNFVMSEAVPYGQSYTYHSTDPMDEMLKPDYYQPVAGQVRAGDAIRILHTDREEVLEVAEVLVTSHKSGLKFYTTRKPEKTSQDKKKPGPKPKLRELKVQEDKGCAYLVDNNNKVWGEYPNAAEARKAKPEQERAA